MEAQRLAAAEKSRIDAENARAKAELKKLAIQRRALAAEEQKVKDEEIAKIFKTVQTKNTKEAYQKFIYDYPFGAYADKAKQEMAKNAISFCFIWSRKIKILHFPILYWD